MSARVWVNGKVTIGPRTLLARTCEECGELRPGGVFATVAGGYKAAICSGCNSRRRRARSPEQREKESRQALAHRVEQNNLSLATATRSGQPWTGVELEVIATHPDLSIATLAQMLGRTHNSIRQARYLVTHDPAKARLAGMESGE